MRKIKIGLLAIGYWLLATNVAVAFAPSVSTLPGYINTNSFKLSCTADGASAQFYFRKEGGSFSAFGPAINLTTTPCLVQVTSSEVNDQTKYYFKVVVDSVESDEISTTYDSNGPGNVSGYYKEGLSDGARLHYHTPSDSDFSRVIIYRGDTLGFSADSSHEIATVNAGGNSDMTFEDHSGPNKYYYIRALDYAGNSSGLVGDQGTITATVSSSSAPVGSVIRLPKEEGSVLGSEATPSNSPEAASTSEIEGGLSKTGLVNWILTHKKISLGILAILVGLVYFLRRRSK